MSSLQYFDYEGFGEQSKKNINYSQAVRIDNRIEISGQGGWDRVTEEYPQDLGEEVDRAFDNVDHALKQAGGTGLDQVYKLRIYITGPMDGYFEHLIRHLKEGKAFKDDGPLLTVVQVKALFKMMRIEMEAEAYLDS